MAEIRRLVRFSGRELQLDAVSRPEALDRQLTQAIRRHDRALEDPAGFLLHRDSAAGGTYGCDRLGRAIPYPSQDGFYPRIFTYSSSPARVVAGLEAIFVFHNVAMHVKYYVLLHRAIYAYN